MLGNFARSLSSIFTLDTVQVDIQEGADEAVADAVVVRIGGSFVWNRTPSEELVDRASLIAGTHRLSASCSASAVKVKTVDAELGTQRDSL